MVPKKMKNEDDKKAGETQKQGLHVPALSTACYPADGEQKLLHYF